MHVNIHTRRYSEGTNWEQGEAQKATEETTKEKTGDNLEFMHYRPEPIIPT